MQVTIYDVNHHLKMMGFTEGKGKYFISAACLLYAGGVHKMQDICQRISTDTGISSRKIYDQMTCSLKLAWNNKENNPRDMYNNRATRLCPPLKKFIKRFVESVMEVNIDD